MKIQQLLEHHGIVANPFADEDAQTDPVFKAHCLDASRHPSWDKVYGTPADPATSIVFGEKGAGKTAMRLQIAAHIEQHNAENPNARLYVIDYDDFNPFLDRFADKLSTRKRRNPDRILAEWKLWDHMDAILSLGVTSLVDRVLSVRQPSGSAANRIREHDVAQLDRQQARDLLLLAACYDASSSETFQARWSRLRRKLHLHNWFGWWDRALGWFVTVFVLIVIGANAAASVDLAADTAGILQTGWEILKAVATQLSTPWPYLIAGLGWLPWLANFCRWSWRARRVVRNVRCGDHAVQPLRQVLSQFAKQDISGQPLPDRPRTDDRYELLGKLQGVLRTLGFHGILVLVDRVDEPHLINGASDRMRTLVWSMLDNKFLKQPGVGLKLLLPMELAEFLQNENRDFYQRARLDKQNMIPSLEWTGEALYDLANVRLQGCAEQGREPNLRALLDDAITDERLIEAFRSLRVPRHLFKFLYRLLVAHCNAHTDSQPVWQVPLETFEATLAIYARDQHAVDQGLRAG